MDYPALSKCHRHCSCTCSTLAICRQRKVQRFSAVTTLECDVWQVTEQTLRQFTCLHWWTEHLRNSSIVFWKCRFFVAFVAMRSKRSALLSCHAATLRRISPSQTSPRVMYKMRGYVTSRAVMCSYILGYLSRIRRAMSATRDAMVIVVSASY